MSLLKIISKFSNDIINNKISICSYDTPIGKMYGAADEKFLYILCFEDSKNLDKAFFTLCQKMPCKLVETKNKILLLLENELEAYFKGNLKKFTLPVKSFGSDFQQHVWNKLQELPYASTETYGDLAKALGRSPSHARAVGAACGANPHVVVIPCHRLVATNSKGGFSCGVNRKEWLLEHEKKHTY